MGVTGFKSLQDKNFKHIAKEIRKKSYLFSIFKKERVKKYAKKKRFLALLLALVVALPFIQSPLTAQAADEGSVARKITVVKGKDINDIQYKGSNVLHSSAWWYDDDGTKHPAFCVDPKLAGPGEIAAGKYDVNGTVN